MLVGREDDLAVLLVVNRLTNEVVVGERQRLVVSDGDGAEIALFGHDPATVRPLDAVGPKQTLVRVHPAQEAVAPVATPLALQAGLRLGLLLVPLPRRNHQVPVVVVDVLDDVLLDFGEGASVPRALDEVQDSPRHLVVHC